MPLTFRPHPQIPLATSRDVLFALRQGNVAALQDMFYSWDVFFNKELLVFLSARTQAGKFQALFALSSDEIRGSQLTLSEKDIEEISLLDLVESDEEDASQEVKTANLQQPMPQYTPVESNQDKARQYFIENAVSTIKVNRNILPENFAQVSTPILEEMFKAYIPEIAVALLQAGVSVPIQRKEDAIIFAVKKDNPELLKALLDSYNNEISLLRLAANTAITGSYSRTLKYVLTKKAVGETLESFLSLNQLFLLGWLLKNKNKSMPAVESVMELLLQNGVQIDAQDKNGYTVLHHAVSSRSTWQLIPFLLAHGASLQVRNQANRTPQDIAQVIANHSTRPNRVPLEIIESFIRQHHKQLSQPIPQAHQRILSFSQPRYSGSRASFVQSKPSCEERNLAPRRIFRRPGKSSASND